MKDALCSEFQENVSQFLIRHQSILDVLSKTQESSARLNRAVIKAVTNCGCIKIQAEKNNIPENCCLDDLKAILDSHLHGELCQHCSEIVLTEVGKNLFYLTALCSTLNLSLDEVIQKENSKIKTLRKFNFT